MNFGSKHHTPSDVDTPEAYAALPLAERTRKVWYWLTPWYLEVYALKLDSDELLDFSSGSFSRYYAFLKKEFPIQYFLRSWDRWPLVMWLDFKWRDLKGFYYKIKRFFKPHHPLMLKTIGREWRDLRNIFVDVLYAGVVEFIELEKCFEVTVYDDTPEHIAFAATLKEVYDFIKNGRPALLHNIEKSYPSKEELKAGKQRSATFEELYAKNLALEKELEDKDTKYLTWVIQYRNYFWT